MNINKITLYYLLTFIFCISIVNASSDLKLNKINLNLENTQSIQRGAKIFFEQCQGCHSLKYMRYSDLASGIKLNFQSEKNINDLIKEKFMHSIEGINENSSILSSMNKEMSTKWFGKVPPDLSLVGRYRGANWIYTYMKSFYKDSKKPFGVNNLIFPDVGMPHILLKYQGIQILKNENNHSNIDDMLELIENGELSKEEYNDLIIDLTTFLSYVSEPIQSEREKLGKFVLIFLGILIILLYMLKKEFWSDIK